jgi:hypothetical protein
MLRLPLGLAWPTAAARRIGFGAASRSPAKPTPQICQPKNQSPLR